MASVCGDVHGYNNLDDLCEYLLSDAHFVWNAWCIRGCKIKGRAVGGWLVLIVLCRTASGGSFGRPLNYKVTVHSYVQYLFRGCEKSRAGCRQVHLTIYQSAPREFRWLEEKKEKVWLWPVVSGEFSRTGWSPRPMQKCFYCSFLPDYFFSQSKYVCECEYIFHSFFIVILHS